MDHLSTQKLEGSFFSTSKLIAHCKISGERVTSDQWQQITITDDEAIWWKCPICQGWHIIVIDRDY